ncbi:hypothetical protein CK203_068635 [Vitis vinifera]|uniref:Endoplasmic reticulum transmembrane protein n=1 Tax=Vitis vinifera TaxID=29760 RepID=A0A438EEE8_VITVI|nr:hypothetical protein CK203_068635 [Vitis vinifera]
MIQLLFTVIFAEMAMIMVLLFKTPLRKLVIMGLDRVKRGRGPIMVKTVAATVLVVLISSVYSMMKIRKRGIDDDVVNPTDQVLMAKHLLETSLMELDLIANYNLASLEKCCFYRRDGFYSIQHNAFPVKAFRFITVPVRSPSSSLPMLQFPPLGFTLFLALMIDRLHHYIRELRLRRKSMEAIKKQNRGFEDGKTGGSAEIKAMEEEMAALGAKLKQLESEIETKTKEAKAAETNAVALRKQSEGFLLEYDRLLEENQNLRNQLQSLDRRLSHSGSKKNT